jgi:hypothetical protein
MTSKLPYKKFHENNFQIMFQFVFLTIKFKKKTNTTFLKLFLNAMIKNIKIHNIIDNIGFSKSMELNKCIQFIFL